MREHDRIFNAMGDATRRAILDKLRTRPLTVAEIAGGLPVSRPAVSQHIKVLKAAGLVKVEQVGTRSICQIDPQGVIAMRDWLDRFWDSAIAAFKQKAEKNFKK